MNAIEMEIGKEQIEKICREHNLEPESICIVHKLLEKWEELIRKPGNNFQVILKEARNSSQKDQIISTVLKIIVEFLEGGEHEHR